MESISVAGKDYFVGSTNIYFTVGNNKIAAKLVYTFP
jgi:hypothetical protein